MNRKYGIQAVAGLLMCVLFLSSVCRAQEQKKLSKDEQSQISEMMRAARDDVKKNYYDPKLAGLDWDARYRQYDANIAKSRNLGDGFRLIAAFLGGLKDSHTFFSPPERANTYEGGYRITLEGNDGFITQVRPGADAESKLHIGDQIVTIDGYSVNRDDYHDLRYYFRVLAPQASAKFDLLSPTGEERQVIVNSIIKPNSRAVTDLTSLGAPKNKRKGGIPADQTNVDYDNMLRHDEDADEVAHSRTIENGDAVLWKYQRFDDLQQVESAMSAARRHKALILDLRGNKGGSAESLEMLVGSLFDHDVKICDRAGRKELKPLIASHRGQPFTGKLIVLVDAGSASYSEVLARVVQLEHRGTVIGDRTAGSVMEPKYYGESLGMYTKIFYGFNVTEDNLIMSDGKSLEKTGVTPDELLLPTGADLAAGRDPVLAHAAELAGVKLDPDAAGKLFPFEWPPLQ